MSHDQLAAIFGWRRGSEADAQERNLPQTKREGHTLWVRSDRRSFPMDWAWYADSHTEDEFIVSFRYINESIAVCEYMGDELDRKIARRSEAHPRGWDSA